MYLSCMWCRITSCMWCRCTPAIYRHGVTFEWSLDWELAKGLYNTMWELCTRGTLDHVLSEFECWNSAEPDVFIWGGEAICSNCYLFSFVIIIQYTNNIDYFLKTGLLDYINYSVLPNYNTITLWWCLIRKEEIWIIIFTSLLDITQETSFL